MEGGVMGGRFQVSGASAARMLLPLLLVLFPAIAFAQSVNIDMTPKIGAGAAAGGTQLTGQVLRLVALLTVLSLAPGILMMVTSFTRIIIVFSLLRSAIGLQQTPPNTVLVSLALFLTAFIMQPTFERAYHEGIEPLMADKITEKEALEKSAAPFHAFMRSQVRKEDIALFMDLSGSKTVEKPEDLPYRALIPAFMISELRRAFEIGFLVFIPFLIIDMMVAATLMSMGMMMLPPVLISLPFKIIFFVLVDGWHMLSESLVRSFGTGG